MAPRSHRTQPVSLLASAAGSALLTALIAIGITVAFVTFAVQRGLAMLQLSQSTLIKSDGAALERALLDGLSCLRTLGPFPVTCGGTIVLRGSDGTALTDAQGLLGGYLITPTCTGSPPNSRLLFTARASKPDPLHPSAGPAVLTLFKNTGGFTSPYPCFKYMNIGPRFSTQAYPATQVTAGVDCTCNQSGALSMPSPVVWCHSSITMQCPTGYSAALPATSCAYPYGGTQLGDIETAYAGAGTFTANFTGGSATTVTLGANQGYINCCAPQGATPNPAFLNCVRN